jgi:hypothetical protein
MASTNTPSAFASTLSTPQSSLGEIRRDDLGIVYLVEEISVEQGITKPKQVMRLQLYSYYLTSLSDKEWQHLLDAVQEAKQISNELPVVHVLSAELLTNEERKAVRSGNEPKQTITMNWVPGVSLQQWGKDRSPSLQQALALVIQLAQLAQKFWRYGYQHLQLIIHPERILLQTDNQGQPLQPLQPIILDLGFDRPWKTSTSPNPLVGRPLSVAAQQRQLRNEYIEALASLLLHLWQGKLEEYKERIPEGQWRTWLTGTDPALQQSATVLAAVLPRAFGVGQPYLDIDTFIKDLQRAHEQVTALAPSQGSQPETSGKVLTSNQIAALRQYDQLIWSVGQQAESKIFHLVRDLTVIGDAPDDTPQLSALGPHRLYLARQHVISITNQQLEGYTIADTGNGVTDPSHYATLDEIPLSPHFAAVFSENSVLAVAPYQFRLKVARPSIVDQFAAARLTVLPTGQRQFKSEAGGKLLIQLMVQNISSEVDRLWFVLDNAPQAWELEFPEAKELYANETYNTSIAITPDSGARSKAYLLILRVISTTRKAQVAAAYLKLEIVPRYAYTGYLDPEVVRVGAAGELFLENLGNLARTFQIVLRDRHRELVFEPPQAAVIIQPNETSSIVYRAYVREWRWFGREKQHPISVLVAPQGGGEPTVYPGQVISRSLIPGWLLILVPVLLLALLWLASFLLRPEFTQTIVQSAPNSRAWGTPVAGEPVTLTWRSLNTCFYSVYDNGNALTLLQRQKGITGTYPITPTIVGNQLEVRVRSCFPLFEKSWQVAVAPMPTLIPAPGAAPQIQSFTVSSPQLLIGQLGDICLQWQVQAQPNTTLTVLPALFAPLSELAGRLCKPIAALTQEFSTPQTVTITLKSASPDGQVAQAAAYVRLALPVCYVNTTKEVAIREGPGRIFPERGYLAYNPTPLPLLASARPFTPREQETPEPWVEFTLLDDPRPGWLPAEYLACPDLSVLPPPDLIPATPTLTPTATPTPTLTPTPALVPTVTIIPEVITVGGCALVKWDIQQVKEVFLNDEGVVGVAEKQICPAEAGELPLVWRIVKNDGSTSEISRKLLVNPGAGGTPPPPPE